MGSFLHVPVGAKLWGQKGARKLQWALCLLSRILDVFKCLSWSMRLLIGIVSKYCSELLLSALPRKPTGTLDCSYLEAIGREDFIVVRTSWIYTSLKVTESIGQHFQYINNAQRTKVVSLPIIEFETQVNCYIFVSVLYVIWLLKRFRTMLCHSYICKTCSRWLKVINTAKGHVTVNRILKLATLAQADARTSETH